MKKVFLLLALVATYGVSIAMSGADVNSVNIDQVTVVADNNDAEPEKEKTATKEATTTKAATTKTAKSSGCASAKSEGCASAKSEGCATEKSAGCSGDKAKAKKDDSK